MTKPAGGAAATAEPLLLRAALDGRTQPRKLVQHYAWSIPSSAALRTIAQHSPRGVVEIGAGTGYWAFELAQAGVNVQAFDPRPRVTGLRGMQSWHPVKSRDHMVAADHPDRTLLIVWPTAGAAWADEALRSYKGSTVVYAGPDTGGCCATPEFFARLASDWERLETVSLPAFGGGRPDDGSDRLHVYRRRVRPITPGSAARQQRDTGALLQAAANGEDQDRGVVARIIDHLRSAGGAVRTVVVFAGGVAATTVAVITTVVAGGGGGGGATCTGADVTTGTFSARVTSAVAGNVLCLDTGAYGTWTGTNKAITVQAATGQTPTMTINFTSGGGFTLDGMSGMSGDINGASNLTIKNSSFTDQLFIDGPSTDGIVLDGDKLNWPFLTTSDTDPNAKLYLASGLTGTLASPSVTFENGQIENSDLDGIHFGGGSGFQIVNNEIKNICGGGVNHTDVIQWDRNTFHDIRIAHNYIHADPPCDTSTQGISEFDSGVDGAIIEDNVIQVWWGPVIALYGDKNTIVRHNTVEFFPAAATNTFTQCDFFGQTCGRVELGPAKTGDPHSTGEQVIDNIAGFIDPADSTGTTINHNLCNRSGCGGTGTLSPATPVFVGGATPSTYAGFCLAPGSPGKGAASDGLDMGIRC